MRLDHLHVFCRSLEPSIVFLAEAFGAKIAERRLMGGKPGAVLELDGLNIFLKETGEGTALPNWSAETCGCDHLGFVVDDLEATLKTLCARKDTRLTREPFRAGKRMCAFVAGPDDLSVELMQQME